MSESRTVRFVNGPAAGRTMVIASGTPIRWRADDDEEVPPSTVLYDLKEYPDGSWIGSTGTETFYAVLPISREISPERAHALALYEWREALVRAGVSPIDEPPLVLTEPVDEWNLDRWRIVGEVTR